MDKSPKRRKFKDNPYTLSSDSELNIYIVSFKDSKNINQNIYVTKEIYNVFNEFELKELSQLHEFDNHIEHLELEEEQLYNRIKEKPIEVEKIVTDKILLNNVINEIQKLPELQKSRFIKHYFENMSYEEIARQERCSGRAVKYSVDRAFEKILKKLKF